MFKKAYRLFIGIFGLFFRLAQNINFGSINSCLLVDLFKVNTKQGNNIKLDSIPKASVMAINPPRAAGTKIKKIQKNLKIKRPRYRTYSILILLW
jgi:hypothetical protein